MGKLTQREGSKRFSKGRSQRWTSMAGMLSPVTSSSRSDSVSTCIYKCACVCHSGVHLQDHNIFFHYSLYHAAVSVCVCVSIHHYVYVMKKSPCTWWLDTPMKHVEKQNQSHMPSSSTHSARAMTDAGCVCVCVCVCPALGKVWSPGGHDEECEPGCRCVCAYRKWR